MSANGHLQITCPVCNKTRTIKRSWIGRVSTCGSKACTHELKLRNVCANIEARIQTPLDELLYRYYVVEKQSFRGIEKSIGINGRTVKKLLVRFGIDVRHGSEAIKTQWVGNDTRRKNASDKLQIVLSKQKRENHPCWRGGFKYDYSGESWIKYSKEIRKRDRYKCTLCGMTNNECIKRNKKSLDVHHIIPYQLSLDNSPGNLRTLCAACHKLKDTEFKWLL